jgi:dimeric dUTPase (all-alpha-NTP-PPase superfamily)
MSRNKTKTVNPENSCASLFTSDVPKLNDPLVDMFNIQMKLQKHLAARGRGVDYEMAPYMECINDITVQWRNLTLEFAELLERLPFKEWKTYSPEQKAGAMTDEEHLELLYEYADMFHFFMNIGLALGVDGQLLEKLYVTKNKENIDRQKRGY